VYSFEHTEVMFLPDYAIKGRDVAHKYNFNCKKPSFK
jgi:hypothetical protein